MKSLQEILLDSDIARRTAGERERRRANALAARRAPIWPYIISIVAWPVLAVAILLADPTVKIQPVFVLAPLFFAGSVVQVISICRKRQKAWLMLIEEEAPGLHAKLK